MDLDVDGPTPWAVYINDLRMVCEIVRSPAELVCYVRWRDRLELGRTAIASDEADVFGAFLLRGQYTDVEGIIQIGSHSTDFDRYYMGEGARDASIEKPTMFSTPLVDRFVDRLVADRPPGRRMQQMSCSGFRSNNSRSSIMQVLDWETRRLGRGRKCPIRGGSGSRFGESHRSKGRLSGWSGRRNAQ